MRKDKMKNSSRKFIGVKYIYIHMYTIRMSHFGSQICNGYILIKALMT